MTAYALLAAIAAIIGAFLGLKRKASRERDARVQAEIDRDVAQGRADVAEATVIVAAEVAADKDAGHADASQVEAAAQEATEHPERAAARERQRIHDETARRAASRVRGAILRARTK